MDKSLLEYQRSSFKSRNEKPLIILSAILGLNSCFPSNLSYYNLRFHFKSKIRLILDLIFVFSPCLKKFYLIFAS